MLITNGRDPGQTRGNGDAAHRAIGIREKRRRDPSRSKSFAEGSNAEMGARFKDVMTTRVVAVRDRLSYLEGQ